MLKLYRWDGFPNLPDHNGGIGIPPCLRFLLGFKPDEFGHNLTGFSGQVTLRLKPDRNLNGGIGIPPCYWLIIPKPPSATLALLHLHIFQLRRFDIDNKVIALGSAHRRPHQLPFPAVQVPFDGYISIDQFLKP